MEVVVAARGCALSVEGDTDGLAEILVKVNDLVGVLGACDGGEGVVAALILPLDSVGLGPCDAAVGGDHDHKGLAAVALEATAGSCAAVGRQGQVEGKLSRGSGTQVDGRSNQPLLAAGSVKVDAIVSDLQTIALGARVSPC